MAKVKKKRASKYEEKVSIKGTFEDVIKVSVTPTPKKAEGKLKKEKK